MKLALKGLLGQPILLQPTPIILNAEGWLAAFSAKKNVTYVKNNYTKKNYTNNLHYVN